MINRKLLTVFIIACAAFFLVNCGKTTPKGEFKKIDLRAKLPADVAATPDEMAKENTKEVSVGDPAAKVLIKWRTVKKGNSAYTLSAAVEVPEAINGFQLTDVSVQEPVNTGTEDAVVQTNIILIGWDASRMGSTHAGVFSGVIKATGEFSQL